MTMYFLFQHTVAQIKNKQQDPECKNFSTSISFASLAIWSCLNLKKNNLPSASQSLKKIIHSAELVKHNPHQR